MNEKTDIMDESSFRVEKLVFSLPVVLTFYDCIQEAYSTSLYVRKGTAHDAVEPLVRAVADLSLCVLGRYRIGDTTYALEGKDDAMKAISLYAMGTMKWRVSYTAKFTHANHHVSRSFGIPGRDPQTSLFRSKVPDLRHPKWMYLLKLLGELTVSEEGYEPVAGSFNAVYQSGNWPPKRAKKRLKQQRKSK